ncbi:8-oxoguanine DNA glycosylase OGG fold protein [Crystallibacter degradans]|uniref:8-oxoguanine DNA glycosylase OGG fold protein n=1 Tax=Crystallibacter degradans TaxID=2726743 RepID=UPI0014736BEB|nr:hypothetical protein [Arthrobacter sp. SF27]NMR32379.1 hypothetical protein [Arthrobacter sp. SF27]
MLNLTAPFPDDLHEALPGSAAVLNHRITVDADRWAKELTARELPVPSLFASATGRFRISRADVFSLGAVQPSKEGALELLLASMAWGLGLTASRMHARLDGIQQDPEGAAERLAEAWLCVRANRSQEEAYSILTTPRGAGRIRMLGPAFATKFLYFAQGPEATPRHLILDKVIAGKLRPFAWPDSPPDSWWPGTYANYCMLMSRWAVDAAIQAGHPVRADEIEYSLFRS